MDSATPALELPLKAGVGPYSHLWCDFSGDDWLYISGYTGLNRIQYSDNGNPFDRFSLVKFDTSLNTINRDDAGYGAIKRYRYMEHGLDDLMFLTGTHTAAPPPGYDFDAWEDEDGDGRLYSGG